MKKGENIFLVIAIMFAAAVLLGSYNIPLFVVEPLTPSMYAVIICSLLIAVCVLKLAINLFGSKAKEGGKVVVGHPKIIVYQILMSLVYAFGFTKVGFFTSTFIYLTISLCVFAGTKEPKTIIKYAIGSLAFTGFLFFIFDMFSVFLPNTLFF